MELIALNIILHSAIKYIKVYFIALLQCNKVNFNVLYCIAFPNNCRKFNKIIYVIDLVILNAIIVQDENNSI